MDNGNIIEEFSAKMYGIEKYNSTHGNAYINGQNYILASQAIKILKDILEREGVK